MSEQNQNQTLTIAIPKGRLMRELLPVLEAVGLTPEPAFFDDKDRRLIFASSDPSVRIVPVKPFDVATFVSVGGADLGIVGADVLQEFDFSEVYAPVDLGIGHCRLSVAVPDEAVADHSDEQKSHVRIATKYPNLTRAFYAARGIQAECIKLNGAIELAPKLGLTDRITDIVTTGNTLRANGLTEMDSIISVTSRLAVNRTAAKVRAAEISGWVSRFAEAVAARQAAA